MHYYSTSYSFDSVQISAADDDAAAEVVDVVVVAVAFVNLDGSRWDVAVHFVNGEFFAGVVGGSLVADLGDELCYSFVYLHLGVALEFQK